MTLLRQEGWTRWPTEVPSNPYHSVILWQGEGWGTQCLFTSVFTGKFAFRNPRLLRWMGKALSKEDLAWRRIRLGTIQMKQTYMSSQSLMGCTHKCCRSQMMSLRPLSNSFERLQQLGNVPEDWKKANATPRRAWIHLNKRWIWETIGLTSIPGKTTEP